MHIKYRKLNKFISCFLVIILAFNVSAAVVSDNDGASFISKAEFDSLKNDFQAQLNSFNANIDAKIDDSINAYISGIKTAKEEVVKPIVSNYKDIKWKNDLYVKVSTREFSNYNTYTDTALSWKVPPFGDYRIMRAGRYYFTASDYRDTTNKRFFFSFSTRTWFKADDGWFPSGEGASSVRTNDFGPLVFYCKPGVNSEKPQINTGSSILYVESQMIDRAYPGIATYYGGTIGDVAFENMTGNQWTDPNKTATLSNAGFIEVTKEDDDVVAFRVKFYNRSSIFVAEDAATYSGPYTTNIYRVKKSLSGYGEVQLASVRTAAPANTTWANSNLGEYGAHLKRARWHDGNQLNRDLATLKVLFLGNDTNTKVNCAIQNPVAYFSDWAEYDFSKSEMGSFVADKDSTSAVVSSNSRGRSGFNWINTAGEIISPRLALPLWPKYYLKNLVNPDFTMNGNGLDIGGGIPIATNILTKGTLRVKLKYTVGNDDLAVTTTPSQNIYLSFKKSAYNDTVSTTNFYRDSSNNSLRDKLWEPTTTDTSYTVDIPVDKGDNVWFRLGPKDRTASGLYAQITDLDVRLIIG